MIHPSSDGPALSSPEIAETVLAHSFLFLQLDHSEAIQAILRWEDSVRDMVSVSAATVLSEGPASLQAYCPSELLTLTSFALIDPIEAPPYVETGLLAVPFILNPSEIAGLSIGDTYLLKPQHRYREDLHLHELVHGVQRLILGDYAFIAAYVSQVIVNGYRNNRFEKIAYNLQERFINGERFDLVAEVQLDLRSWTSSLQRNSAESLHTHPLESRTLPAEPAPTACPGTDQIASHRLPSGHRGHQIQPRAIEPI